MLIIFTDSSEDDTIVTKPTKASTPILRRHSKYINTTPLMKKANPMKTLIMKEDTRQRITQAERKNKFRKCILDIF